MDVLSEANRLVEAGQPVISLAVGQPGSLAPSGVRLAASQAAETIVLGYTDALGRRCAREAISQHYQDHYGIAVSPDRIAVTTGSSAGFSLAFLALADVGGRIAISSPGYPAYRNIIRAQSLECLEIPSEGGGFDIDALAAAHREKPVNALLLASPANPTGAALDDDLLRSIIEFCDREGIRFISDEIYHRLRYDGADRCALSFSDDAIIINSFSKYYCMTGWRIGWMVLPFDMVRTIERLAQSLYISTPDISQLAVPAAFASTGELDRIKQSYVANRALLLEALPSMGLPFASPPDGAFYAWCDVSGLTQDSMLFARQMLHDIHVATAPGLDFDTVNGHRYLRISYAGAHDRVAEALTRMADWIDSKK